MLLINVRHRWPEPPGAIITHKNSHREYVCLHFYNQVELTYNNRCETVQAGAFIVFSPDTSLSYKSEKPYLVDKMFIIGNVDEIMKLYSLKTDTLYFPSNGIEITKIIETLEFEFYKKHSWGYRYIDIKIEELFIIISSNLPADKLQVSVGIEMQHHLQIIHLEINAYPERNWSNKNICMRLNISESYLYYLYHMVYHITPTRDVILARTARAKILLEQGMTIEETAEKCGYNNVYHFIRQFHQVTQFTPYQYSLCHRK